MKLFSKRQHRLISKDDLFLQRRRLGSRRHLVSNEVRNRIISEIRYITSNDDFLEFFILFDDQKKEKNILMKIR